nr:DNA-directed DNA polymerase [Tanacetum cinerariifolium]
MKELSEQLKELSDKGFIRPSSSPWGAPLLFHGPFDFSSGRGRRRCLRKSRNVPFPGNFVVVDFAADPRVPLILRRSFLKTGCALIDVYERELTLRTGKEAVTFNLDQTSRYSTNYDAMSVNQIDLIDIACEEYSQEVLGFSVSGNPTPCTKPIVSTSSPTPTPFGDSDFLLEETDAFLAIDDVPISPEIDDCYYDSEGDILLLEEFLNDDPSSPPLPPQELKVVEPTNKKSSIDEPPMVELKDLPPHLEYAFLEGDDKLPIITDKDLKDKEKTTLIKVLKSHKQALAWTMETTIEQQAALNEALIPSAQRCPFYKAFLVITNVPEIYMQEFWATTNVHQHSIRFKMDNKKHIPDLESFRNILHICPRVQGQSFAELPFEEEILDFIRFLRHNATITPKPKASVRRTRGDSDTSITPPTAIATPRPTAAATPRLTAAAKGKQIAKAPKAKSLSAPSKVARTEAQQLKIVLKRSKQQTHISQPGGSGTDKGTGSKPGVPDVPTDESKEELSWNSSDDEGADDQEKVDDDDEGDEGKSNEEVDDEETRVEESFDPIPHTPESSKDEGDGSKVAVQLQSDRLHEEAQKENDEFLRTVDENIKKIIKEQVKEQVKAQVSKILPRIEQAVNEQLEDEVLTRSSHLSRTSYAVVVADLSEIELKKRLIEKMEGNKSIQRSDAQRNLYKALRRRDDDEDKDEEPSAGPDRGSKRRREGKEPESTSTPSETATKSAGTSTIGSKSRQASASKSAFVEEPLQTTSQMEEPSHLEFEIAVHGSIQSWISKFVKQANSRSSFNELLDTPLDFSNFIMNRLRVDTLTLEILAGPTYELMKGSCKSLIELEYHLEEPRPLIPDNRGRRVIPFAHFINNDLEYLRGGASSRKYTTFVTKTKAADYKHIKWIEDLFYGFAVNRESARDVYSKRRIIAVTELKIVEWHSYKHLDWITVRRNDDKLYKLMRIDELHKFSDGTLNDVRTALDDRLKGIRMRYLPQTIWRKSDKDRAAAMI